MFLPTVSGKWLVDFDSRPAYLLLNYTIAFKCLTVDLLLITCNNGFPKPDIVQNIVQTYETGLYTDTGLCLYQVQTTVQLVSIYTARYNAIYTLLKEALLTYALWRDPTPVSILAGHHRLTMQGIISVTYILSYLPSYQNYAMSMWYSNRFSTR